MISELVGKTITAAQMNDEKDRIQFTCSNGSSYLMHHVQDCCESVSIESVDGDLSDILNSPVLEAEERTNSTEDASSITPLNDYDESWTWTFYTIRTVKGSVTIRWYGTSNGYYSESVEFDKL